MVGIAACPGLVVSCASSVSPEAREAAEQGCEQLTEKLEREDIGGLISSPLVLREAHAAVEPEVDIDEFTAATHEVCPDTLEEMERRIDRLGDG